MSEFVGECRREWKRLRVPDPVANEMAADLTADLKEAEADGASAEDVLGSGAFDPRTFAASWASERGVIPPPPPMPGSSVPRRSRMLAAIAAFVLVAALGAALATVRSGSEQRLALASTVGPLRRALGSTLVGPPGFVAPFAPLGRRIVPVQAFAVRLNGPGVVLHTFGVVLLLIGIVGLILTMLHWSPWTSESPWSRRRTDVNQTPGGTATPGRSA